jgi:hypothetical protein
VLNNEGEHTGGCFGVHKATKLRRAALTRTDFLLAEFQAEKRNHYLYYLPNCLALTQKYWVINLVRARFPAFVQTVPINLLYKRY